MNISKKQLKKALEEAWDSGFSAPLELEASYVPGWRQRNCEDILSLNWTDAEEAAQ